MPVAYKIQSTGTYLGYFNVVTHTTNKNNDKPSRKFQKLQFTKIPGMKTRDFKAMGDIVYGMYVNSSLVKIGKAGGADGWSKRINTYGKDPATDPTNNKIIQIMNKDYKKTTRILVYGFSVSRVQSDFFCPIINDTISIESPRIHEVETYLITEAELEGEDLIFCTQKCVSMYI